MSPDPGAQPALVNVTGLTALGTVKVPPGPDRMTVTGAKPPVKLTTRSLHEPGQRLDGGVIVQLGAGCTVTLSETLLPAGRVQLFEASGKAVVPL